MQAAPLGYIVPGVIGGLEAAAGQVEGLTKGLCALVDEGLKDSDGDNTAGEGNSDSSK